MKNSTIFHKDCSQHSFTVSTSSLITILSLSGVCGIAAIFLNILVILVICHKPALRSMTNYWIVSLAVADLLIATLSVPVWCLKLLQKAHFIEENVHNLFTVIVVLTLSASSLNLLALSYDRYVGVTAPFQYQSRLTPPKVRKNHRSNLDLVPSSITNITEKQLWHIRAGPFCPLYGHLWYSICVYFLFLRANFQGSQQAEKIDKSARNPLKSAPTLFPERIQSRHDCCYGDGLVCTLLASRFD